MSEKQFELKKRHLLLQLLNNLQGELRKQGLWQADKPSELSLNSTLPFAIDTLTFTQWLQFIFIVKINYLLEFSLPLPESISVLPMAKEYFKDQDVNSTEITAIIGRIDLLISENKQ
ncbi:MAG: YqcC family protein [Psychromonas sp.]|nr:YqcC family protein [Psychromonas sp.]